MSCTEIFEIVTNGVSQRYTKRENLKIFPVKVHYNPTSPANIIYLKDETGLNVVPVKMDTSKEHAINMSLPNGNILVFRECNDVLYNLKVNNINKYVMAY